MSSTDSIINPERLEELSGKVMSDVSGAMGVMMAYLGDQSGIYKCMERIGSSSIDQIASESGLLPRYVQEFLAANTALGYVTFDADSETYSSSPEQAAIFAGKVSRLVCKAFFRRWLDNTRLTKQRSMFSRQVEAGHGENTALVVSLEWIDFSDQVMKLTYSPHGFLRWRECRES